MIDHAKLIEAIAATGWDRLSLMQAEAHADALVPALEKFEINTPQRAAACLAQFAHETGGWRWLREVGAAAYFSRYDGRKDLGNTQPGDGARYRGRGYIQVTGRHNYASAEIALDLPLVAQPELLEQWPIAAQVSCWWWQSHGLNHLADKNQITAITRVINGGTNGIEDRKAKWKIVTRILTA